MTQTHHAANCLAHFHVFPRQNALVHYVVSQKYHPIKGKCWNQVNLLLLTQVVLEHNIIGHITISPFAIHQPLYRLLSKVDATIRCFKVYLRRHGELFLQ